MDKEPEERSAFVHDLKIRLTAISGYAQLLERQILESEHATRRQRDYVVRLRRLINGLSNTINEYEDERRAQEQSDSEDDNGPSCPRNSQCMSR